MPTKSTKSTPAPEAQKEDPSDDPHPVTINDQETTWVEHFNRGGVPPES